MYWKNSSQFLQWKRCMQVLWSPISDITALYGAAVVQVQLISSKNFKTELQEFWWKVAVITLVDHLSRASVEKLFLSSSMKSQKWWSTNLSMGLLQSTCKISSLGTLLAALILFKIEQLISRFQRKINQ